MSSSKMFDLGVKTTCSIMRPLASAIPRRSEAVFRFSEQLQPDSGLSRRLSAAPFQQNSLETLKIPNSNSHVYLADLPSTK